MSHGNVETFRRAVDAWNRADRDEWLAEFAPGAEWHTTGRFADEGVYRGRAGLERLWAETRQDIDELSLSVSDIRAVGKETVLVAGAITGRGKRSKAGFEEPGFVVATLRDGLVVRVETYIDSERALEAAGLRE